MTLEELQQKQTELEKQIEDLKSELSSLSEELEQNRREELERQIVEAELQLAAIEEQLNQEENKHNIETTIDITWVEIDILQNNVRETFSTYELLDGSDTKNRLLLIMDKEEFTTQQAKTKYWETAEQRLEYVFRKINETILTYLKGKCNIPENSENYQVLTKTLAPAIERYLMDFLKENTYENNVSDLSLLNTISRDSFTNMVSGLGQFATTATSTFNKGKGLIKAIDFLSIQTSALQNAKHYEALRNPLKCKEFLDKFIQQEEYNPTRSETSIYNISLTEAGLIPTSAQEFWMTTSEQQEIKDLIGNIQVVVDKPSTAKYIFALVEKAQPFLEARNVAWNQALNLLDFAEGSIWTFGKLLGFDIFAELEKSPVMKGVIDMILSLLWFTGGFEGLLKQRYRWKIEKGLDESKREQIRKIFNAYMNSTETKQEENSLKNLVPNVKRLSDSDPKKAYFDIDMPILSKSIQDEMDIDDINPKVLQTLPKTKDFDATKYLTTTEVERNGKRVKELIIDPTRKADLIANKEKFINNYIAYFTNHLADSDKNKKYLESIDSSDSVAFTIISSLYVNPENVIDGVAAKVFLPQGFVEGAYERPEREGEPRIEITNDTDAILEVTSPEVDLNPEQIQTLNRELQQRNSPITAEMLVQSAKEHTIPVTYLAAVIKNDSSYGTAGVAVSTKNPGNVGNTDNRDRRPFNTREEGLDACAAVIKQRVDAYMLACPSTEWFPPIKNLLENRDTEGKGFLPRQANYQRMNPYRTDKAPMGAYMTATDGPRVVAYFVNELNQKLNLV